MRDQREQQNQHGGKADQQRAAVGRSRASSSSNSSRIRNQVKPAGNRKSWIKSGATWRNRARSPAPANRAPKNFADVESPSSAPKRGFFLACDYFDRVRPREVNLALWLRDAFPSSVRSYQALTFYPTLAYGVDNN